MVLFTVKKKVTLYIAKILNRFLMDVDGPVKSLLMECLMPKIGSGNQLKAAPNHLPADISEIEVKDLIYAPVKVILGYVISFAPNVKLLLFGICALLLFSNIENL